VSAQASVSSIDPLDVEKVSNPESLARMVARRWSGRYPVDAFGLDPQIADLVTPAASLLVPVQASGGEHVPATGPAAIVANRGFGLAEPAALGIAVRRATGRRLRQASAPAIPFVGALARRLGAIGASSQDVAAALRAGHLVGVTLSQTWLGTGAGLAPTALLRALPHAPIIPAAVIPGGPLGTPFGAWRVRFGPYVTLDERYDPDDPLIAARFADVMRIAVRALLEED
jgi:hypothetical protein